MASTCRQFGATCTTKLFRVPSPCSLVSTPGRPAAICCSSRTSRRQYLEHSPARCFLTGFESRLHDCPCGPGTARQAESHLGDRPCHRNVFHIQHQCEALVNTLASIAKGVRSRRKSWKRRAGSTQDPNLAERIAFASQAEAEAGTHAQAGDIRTLTLWLAHDVLALASSSLDIRKAMFDFVAEMKRHEANDFRRIRPVRTALENQRDNLLAFVGVQADKLATIAHVHQSRSTSCVLQRKPSTLPSSWQGCTRLRARMGGQFHPVRDVAAQPMTQTPRSSAIGTRRMRRIAPKRSSLSRLLL